MIFISEQYVRFYLSWTWLVPKCSASGVVDGKDCCFCGTVISLTMYDFHSIMSQDTTLCNVGEDTCSCFPTSLL
jgi:hypothetical protein